MSLKSAKVLTSCFNMFRSSWAPLAIVMSVELCRS
jgi:hypothetical protein